MADELPTMTVKLKYSKSGATGQINVADFDPEKHARLDEPEATTPPPPISPASPPSPSAPSEPTTTGEGEPGSTGRRRP